MTRQFEWWDFPGPSRYVNAAKQTLLKSSNFVAAFPAGIGQEWFDYFRFFMAEEHDKPIFDLQDHLNFQSERWSTPPKNIDDIPQSPVQILLSYFSNSNVLDKENDELLHKLLKLENFQGKIIGIVLKNPNSFLSWSKFLLDYEIKSRVMKPRDLTLLLIVTDGIEPSVLDSLFPDNEPDNVDRSIRPSPRIVMQKYDGYARVHDCFAFAWSLLSHEPSSSRQQLSLDNDMKSTLCAQIAQWDHRVCIELCSSHIRITDIQNQNQLKSVINAQDDISNLNQSDDDGLLWSRGALQRVDGNRILHWRVAEELEFKRRVWMARIQCLYPRLDVLYRLPFIELYFKELSRKVSLTNPHVIKDKEDKELRRFTFPLELDVTELFKFINDFTNKRNIRIDRKAVKAAAWNMYDLRNELFHNGPKLTEKLENFNWLINMDDFKEQ
jgi:hypothetical protein